MCSFIFVGFCSLEFDTYLKNVQICSDVEAIFGKKNKLIKTYSGRNIKNDIVIVAVSLECQDDEDIVKYCMDECRDNDICVHWAFDEEEDIAICNYMYDHSELFLPQERKKNIQNVINKYTDYLMIAHTNLNAIKASAFRSRRKGTDILREECIVLYCTGKYNIPFLETPFPQRLDGYPVDVREHCFTFAVLYKKVLSMGLSVGPEGKGILGTIGSFVDEIDHNSTQKCGFLTCSHVCFELPKLYGNPNTRIDCSASNHKIVQPPSGNNNSSDQSFCGKVSSYYFGGVTVDKNKIVGVDIAHVRIENNERIPSRASLTDSHCGKFQFISYHKHGSNFSQYYCIFH